MCTRSVFGLALLVAAITWQSAPDAFASETAKAFFKGKVITYIVAAKPGGGYDTYARLITRHMATHMPGTKIKVENVPGAGNIIGANRIYRSKPDGLTIGTFNTGLVYAQLLGREGVKFDLAKMVYIGKAASDPRVLIMSTQSDIGSFDDLMNAKD